MTHGAALKGATVQSHRRTQCASRGAPPPKAAEGAGQLGPLTWLHGQGHFGHGRSTREVGHLGRKAGFFSARVLATRGSRFASFPITVAKFYTKSNTGMISFTPRNLETETNQEIALHQETEYGTDPAEARKAIPGWGPWWGRRLCPAAEASPAYREGADQDPHPLAAFSSTSFSSDVFDS